MSKLYKFVLTLKEKHGCLNFYFLAVLTVKEVVLPLVSSSSLLIKSLWKILLINQVSPIKIISFTRETWPRMATTESYYSRLTEKSTDNQIKHLHREQLRLNWFQLSSKIFWSSRSVCRMFQAVGAENLKAFFPNPVHFGNNKTQNLKRHSIVLVTC